MANNQNVSESHDASPSTASTEAVTPAQFRALQADATINRHVALASGTGFIPVPIFDVVATTGVQADLLLSLFRIYGHDITKERARSIVTVLLGASLPSLLTRTVVSAFKLVPGVGTALGFFTSPALAGGSTYAVGKVVQEHLVNGGNALDFELSKAKAKVGHELSKIKTASGEMIVEGKDRVANAVGVLRGKKVVAPSLEGPSVVTN